MDLVEAVALSELLRITLLVILLLPWPLIIKLLLVFVGLELIEGRLPSILSGTPATDYFTSFVYNMQDKICDTVIEWVVFFYLIWYCPGSVLNIVLLILLLYRTVGVILFLHTRRGNTLVAYPNAFRYFAYYVALVYDGYLCYNIGVAIFSFLAAIIFALGSEYNRHYGRVYN